MGVMYDPKFGIREVNHNCGAEVGDHVIAWGVSYVVVEIDDFGCYVCRNLNEDCLANDEYKTFDDIDIECVYPPVVGFGEGI